MAADYHRFRGADGLYGSEVGFQVPVLVIEYRRVSTRTGKRQVVPFSVVTTSETWDVEWCRRDQCCYWHSSGSGLWLPWREWNAGIIRTFSDDGKDNARPIGPDDPQTPRGIEWFGRCRYYASQFANPENSRVPIWWERQAVDFSRRLGKTKVRDPEKYLRECGYVPLAQPLNLGGTRNPFETEDFQNGTEECTYCSTCRDCLPSGDSYEPCRHLYWCNDCGMFRGIGADEGPCEHEKKGERE